MNSSKDAVGVGSGVVIWRKLLLTNEATYKQRVERMSEAMKRDEKIAGM